MEKLSHTTGKPVTDLSQRVGVRQLAEQHRHQLRPATEALRGSLRLVFLYQCRKFKAGKLLQQLIEQA